MSKKRSRDQAASSSGADWKLNAKRCRVPKRVQYAHRRKTPSTQDAAPKYEGEAGRKKEAKRELVTMSIRVVNICFFLPGEM